ncbi:MAG: NAD(P)/FAD-dependent oxidoreductase [Chitinophagaceae bacterium]
MERQEPKASYDVVIIGSGIGGLTAGALLSKAGLTVCVLEKEPHPGGYLAGFSRKAFRFDTAIHWLNQYSKEGMVCRLFDALGNDYPKAVTQKRIRRFKGDDYEYLLTNTPDDLKEQWKKEFPADAAGIDKFFLAAKKVGGAFKNFGNIFRAEETMTFTEKLFRKKNLIRFAFKFIPHLRFSGEKGVKKGLAKYFKSKQLQEVFSADTEILSCIVPIGWAYNNDFQSPPQGGGQVIAEWLEHLIHYFKQDTFYRCEVKEILTRNNTAYGVSCERNGKICQIESKYVIAASDAPSLYNKLLARTPIPEKLKKNLAQAELYSSSVTVSIALDCPVETLGFNEELIHLSSAQVPRLEQAGGNPLHTEIVVLAPSFRDKSLAPDGHGTLLLFMPAEMKFENEWRTEKDNHGNFIRGMAYKELKDSVAQQLIQRVEDKIAPGLRKHILFYDVATPVTHFRYTGNTGGSMMATKPNRPNMMNKVATYHTPVKNLLVGGHWAELGGGVPIAVKAGANAAMLILKKEKTPAYKALAAYVDGATELSEFLQNDAFKAYSNNWVQKPTPAQKKQNRMSTADSGTGDAAAVQEQPGDALE